MFNENYSMAYLIVVAVVFVGPVCFGTGCNRSLSKPLPRAWAPSPESSEVEREWVESASVQDLVAAVCEVDHVERDVQRPVADQPLAVYTSAPTEGETAKGEFILSIVPLMWNYDWRTGARNVRFLADPKHPDFLEGRWTAQRRTVNLLRGAAAAPNYHVAQFIAAAVSARPSVEPVLTPEDLLAGARPWTAWRPATQALILGAAAQGKNLPPEALEAKTLYACIYMCLAAPAVRACEYSFPLVGTELLSSAEARGAEGGRQWSAVEVAEFLDGSLKWPSPAGASAREVLEWISERSNLDVFVPVSRNDLEFPLEPRGQTVAEALSQIVEGCADIGGFGLEEDALYFVVPGVMQMIFPWREKISAVKWLDAFLATLTPEQRAILQGGPQCFRSTDLSPAQKGLLNDWFKQVDPVDALRLLADENLTVSFALEISARIPGPSKRVILQLPSQPSESLPTGETIASSLPETDNPNVVDPDGNPTTLLRIAMVEVRRCATAPPTSLKWVRASRVAAERYLSGVEDMEPEAQQAEVYVIELQGQFIIDPHKGPPGSEAPRGTHLFLFIPVKGKVGGGITLMPESVAMERRIDLAELGEVHDLSDYLPR